MVTDGVNVAIHVADAAQPANEIQAAFTDLPADALQHVCLHLPARDIVKLCVAYRAASLCCDAAFISERAAAIGLASGNGDVGLEVISLHEDLSASISSVWPQPEELLPDFAMLVGFEFGGTLLDDNDGRDSGVPHSRGRLRAIAHAVKRHPAATVVIETHVGPTAPTNISVPYCVTRGAVVAAVLVWHHNIAVERLSVRAWGKRITKHARRSTHPSGDCARAGYGWGEIFVTLHGVEMPRRPDYYGRGVACGCELGGPDDEGALAVKVSDALPTLRAGTSRGRLAAAPLPRLGDGDENEEADEDESSEQDESEDESEDEEDEEDEVRARSLDGGDDDEEERREERRGLLEASDEDEDDFDAMN